MPPKKDEKKGEKKAASPEDALANQLELERQSLAVELAFQKEKLRLLREENTNLHAKIASMQAAANHQAGSTDDIIAHNRREIANAVSRATALEARVNELETQLQERENEISDLQAERAANRRKLEDRSAAVNERTVLEDAVKRQDEIITKQEAETERQQVLIKELEAQLAESTKTIAELQLRSSGTTKLAIFFGEPWLVTRSRHRLYGELPPDREDGTLSHMGNKMVLYGGTVRGAEGLIRDVHWFNIENKSWERGVSAGKQGPGRIGHTASVVGKNKVVIYGGRRQATVLADAHILNTDSVKWSTPALKGVPEPCEGHACCSIRERVYIFGGLMNEALSGELSCFDTETGQWLPVPSYGTAPTPRKGHVTVASEDGRYLWVFGGVDATGPLNDITVLDMDHQTWSAAVAAGGGPAPRDAAVGAMSGKYMLIAGGTDARNRRFHDVWALDTEEMAWEKLYDGTEALSTYSLRPRGTYHAFYGTALYTLRPNREETLDELEVLEFSLPSEIESLIRSKRAQETGPSNKMEILDTVVAGANFLELAWRAPARAADRIDYYKLLMSSSTGVVRDVCEGKFEQYRVTGLRPSTEYVFCVKAVFDDGTHMWSESKAFKTHYSASSMQQRLHGSPGKGRPHATVAAA